MAWEEFFEDWKGEAQLAIYRDGDRYEVVWGHQIKDMAKPVSREAVESFLRGSIPVMI